MRFMMPYDWIFTYNQVHEEIEIVQATRMDFFPSLSLSLWTRWVHSPITLHGRIGGPKCRPNYSPSANKVADATATLTMRRKWTPRSTRRSNRRFGFHLFLAFSLPAPAHSSSHKSPWVFHSSLAAGAISYLDAFRVCFWSFHLLSIRLSRSFYLPDDGKLVTRAVSRYLSSTLSFSIFHRHHLPFPPSSISFSSLLPRLEKRYLRIHCRDRVKAMRSEGLNCIW